MLKHSLIYLTLSILVVLFARYIHLLIVYIDIFFTYLNFQIAPIFSQNSWGIAIRKTLILVLVPLIIVGIPALIYKLIKGKNMPHILLAAWVIWTIIVLSDIMIR